MKKGKGGSSVFLGLVIGVVIGAGGFWVWNQYASKTPADAVSQASQAQVQDLIAKVSKLIVVPTDETPVVATINDAGSLIKQQVFYKGAINGDVVLVYQKAAKAIVYSPSRNIIVNVGPVVLQNAPAATSTSK